MKTQKTTIQELDRFQNWQMWKREYVAWEEEVGEHGETIDAFSVDDKWHPTSERNALFQSMVKDLSAGSKEICRIIFNTPEEFQAQIASASPKIKVTMNRLRTYLRSQGWKFNAIEECFTEIRTGLATLNF